MAQIDAGKLVCIAMPQKFQSERLYINTILKLSYYFHALSRFDRPAEATGERTISSSSSRTKGQEIVTGAESAFADHRAAGIIREAQRHDRSGDPGVHVHSWAHWTNATQTCSCSI